MTSRRSSPSRVAARLVLALAAGAGLAAATAAAPAPALAFQCPSDVRKIDQALDGANLPQERRAEVVRLRDEGQRLHAAGQHEQSMATLARAKQILGVTQ